MSSVAIVLGPPRSLSHRQGPLSSLSFLSWKAANSSAWGLVQCCPWLADVTGEKHRWGPAFRLRGARSWKGVQRVALALSLRPQMQRWSTPFLLLSSQTPPTHLALLGWSPLWPREVASQVPTPVHPLQGLVAFAVHSLSLLPSGSRPAECRCSSVVCLWPRASCCQPPPVPFTDRHVSG